MSESVLDNDGSISETESVGENNAEPTVVMAPRRYSQIMQKFLESKGHYLVLEDVMSKNISEDVLLSIVPEDIVRFFNMKAYGKPVPALDDVPSKCRSSTLTVYKKALSFFSLRCAMQWDDITSIGNATKSKLVNDCIKKVKKCEVRHQGVESKARRPLEWREFIAILEELKKRASKEKTNCEKRKFILCRALFALQWHMISRMDDMCHLSFDNITNNPSFAFALCLKLRWSKNIQEEREAPQQIILGAMDPRLCVLLTLAAYIEFCYKSRQVEGSGFVFGDIKRTQKVLRTVLQGVMSEEGIASGLGLIGTHSFRKGPATYASRCGLSREVISKRGRWKNRARMVDVYIDMNVPLPDATAAAKLCGPNGACKYKLQSDTQVSNGWLLGKVVPGCRDAFGDDTATTLALPILWAAFDDYRVDMLHLDNPPAPHLDPSLKEYILEAYVENYGVLGRDFINPVERVRVLPQGHGAQLIMVEMRPNTAQQDGGGGNQPQQEVQVPDELDGTTHAASESATAILAQQMNTHSCVEEKTTDLMNELARIGLSFSRQFNNIHRAIKRIALQPVLRP